ncbi:MAG TPA: hypothetical protein VFB96_22740 [Pirellulaceae bacterium]|nr:hypothetical protein [Pirellulaceae bacterium]
MSRNGFPKRIGQRLCAAALVAAAMAGCYFAAAPEKKIAAERTYGGDASFAAPYCIEITGSKKRWHVRYPDYSGRLRTGDDRVLSVRNIHVPLNTRVVFILKSADYVYTFAIPEYGLKEIAVPNLKFEMEFQSDKAGKFDLIGEPLCGDPHSEIVGHIVVDPRDRFLAWLERRL